MVIYDVLTPLKDNNDRKLLPISHGRKFGSDPVADLHNSVDMKVKMHKVHRPRLEDMLRQTMKDRMNLTGAPTMTTNWNIT